MSIPLSTAMQPAYRMNAEQNYICSCVTLAVFCLTWRGGQTCEAKGEEKRVGRGRGRGILAMLDPSLVEFKGSPRDVFMDSLARSRSSVDGGRPTHAFPSFFSGEPSTSTHTRATRIPRSAKEGEVGGIFYCTYFSFSFRFHVDLQDASTNKLMLRA
eukprot:gene9550-6706_t